MAITLETNARNVAVAAITGLADAGAGAATIDVATSNAFTTLLATFTLSDPAFVAGAAGTQDLDITPAVSTTALASGTATHWRLRSSTPTLVMTGQVSNTGAGDEDIILDVAAQNAALNAINALINTGASPATLTLFTSDGGTQLVQFSLPNPAFAAASAGAMSMNLPSPANATAAGTCTHFRIVNRSGALVLRGDVGTTSQSVVMNNNIFGIGTTVTFGATSISLPASTGSDGTLVFAGGVVFTLGETLEITAGSYVQPA